MKTRERGQNDPEDLAGRDFRRELEDREREAVRERESKRDRSSRAIASSSSSSASSSSKKPRLEAPSAAPVNLDADDPLEDSDEDSDSDDDDDTAALMAELQKIKREKAVEEQEKEEERKQEEEKIRMENILSGNPLLKDKYASTADKSGDMKVKRRWDDDVVFKNCSRAEPDKTEKTFINDSLRSEFHRKFMDKYIK